MTSPARLTSLPRQEAVRLVRSHPELDRPGGEPFLLVLSVPDEQSASDLRDVLTSVLGTLQAREDASAALHKALIPPGRLPVSLALTEQIHRNAQAQLELADEFGLPGSAEVAVAARSRARNAGALASRWRKEGRIFSVEVDNAARFPGFQFDAGGRPRPVIADVLSALGGRLDGWELALWFTGDNGWLGARRPVDLLESDPARVVGAAAQLAAELAA